MKTLVFYHKADFDGIFCREIARKFLPNAELIGWDYGDVLPEIPTDCELIYILDLSIDELMNRNNIVWIDHHKSAIEKYPSSITGYRIDGVAACRLAWQWFTNQRIDIHIKEDYIDRTVKEPFAVCLAGEYDIWDKRDPRAELFQHGLRSEDLNWTLLFQDDPIEGLNPYVERLLNQGQALQYAKTKENASIIKSYGFDVEFEGLKFLACNHARFNSLLFTAGVKPEHDALLGFNWSGKEWRVSLYHAPSKEHHDLSQIATKFGGGGHRGACGFKTTSLPFLT